MTARAASPMTMSDRPSPPLASGPTRHNWRGPTSGSRSVSNGDAAGNLATRSEEDRPATTGEAAAASTPATIPPGELDTPAATMTAALATNAVEICA